MQLPAITLYTMACLVGAIVPGPTSLLAMTNGTTRNWGIVGAGMLGAAASDILIIAAVGAGLGAVLSASEVAFSMLRWAGVAYLIWLSIQLWRAPTTALSARSPSASLSVRKAFVRSFAVAMSNPKVLLFFTAFLPQFIDPGEPAAAQYALLAMISAVIDVAVMALYAFGGVKAAMLLTSRGLGILNKVGASAMFLLASGLILLRRSNA